MVNAFVVDCTNHNVIMPIEINATIAKNVIAITWMTKDYNAYNNCGCNV